LRGSAAFFVWRERREELVLDARRERKVEMKRHAQNIDRIENGRIKKSLFRFVVKHYFSTQQKF
jgi:chorismate mutase